MSSEIVKGRRGRPNVDSERVDTRFPRTILAALDEFRAEAQGNLSRPEAVRRLVSDALKDAGYLKATEG